MICPYCNTEFEFAPEYDVSCPACPSCKRQVGCFRRDGKDLTKEKCGCYCEATEPYGFVPEAGCPVHDPE